MLEARRVDRATDLVPRNGVLVLSGYGIRVFVERGHLTIEDGIADERRRRRFPRASPGFKRFVVIGHSGLVSLEALRWLHDVGIPVIQIDADGQLIVASGPCGLDDARLRRAQGLAFSNGIGLEIARELIRQKLAGQLEVVEELRDKTASAGIRAESQRIPETGGVNELRLLEGRAALIYWGAWQDLDVFFVQRDTNRVPEHWLTFGARRSLLTGNPRKATNPANAILNYMYSILEAEARIAALTMGLDPGIGVMHADLKARDSLACDLMEAVRPRVDNYVLGLLQGRAFRKSEFFETQDGVCRIMPPLTHLLAQTGDRWRFELAPVAERVAAVLFEGSDIRKTSALLPTRLTERNRRAGRSRSTRPQPQSCHAARPSSNAKSISSLQPEDSG